MVKKSILAKVGDKITYKLIKDGYKTEKGNAKVTEEMAIETVINADAPSTAYMSDLDYEVDISGENPPIINIKNDITCPDDTVISKGKYLFYDIGQEYDVKNTNLKQSNFKSVGGIIINNKVASNFSASNYLTTSDVNLGNANSWEQLWKVRTGNDVSSSYYIYSGQGKNTMDFGVRENIWVFYLSSNGTSWNLASLITNNVQVKINTDYLVKFSFSGDLYKLEVSEDNGSNWVTAGEYSSTTKVYNHSLYCIGNTNDKLWPWNGTIDLSNSYVKIDNVLWKPEFGDIGSPGEYTVTGSPTISSEFIMINFNDSNYITTPNLDYSSPFTLEMHLKLSSYPSGWIFKSPVNYSLDTYFGNSMIIAIGNGSGYHDMTITPSLPFDGKMILKWDGNTYTYTAIDEVSDTTYGPVTYSSSSAMPSSAMRIGYKNCDYIDLKKFIFTSSDSSKSYRVVKDENIINVPGIKDFKLQDSGTELTTKLFDYHYKEDASSQDKASLYINTEKDNDLYYKIENLNLNVSKIGTPTIDNEGIASNFSTSNYLDLPYNFSQSVSGQHWEAAFKFIYTKSSDNQSFLGGDWGSYTPDIYISPDSKLSINLGSTGTSYDIAEGISGNIILNENNAYYIKVSFDGSNYKTYISEDGQTYTNDIDIESSVNIASSTYKSFVGCRAYREWPFKGTIDLTKSYIQIGTNEKQYMAELISNRHNIPSLYSEFIDNITIPTHALYDYVNGEWKVSGDSPLITQDITVNADNAEITMKEIEE